METDDAGQPDTQRSVTIKLPQAPDLGLSGATMIVLVVGVGALLLSGLMQTTALTSNNPPEGLVDASLWFSWIGGAALSLALLFAGLTAPRASHGVRVALVLGGAYFFLTAGTGSSGIMASLAGLFSSFP